MSNKTIQKPIGIMDYPRKSWQKMAFRAPLVLWRMGLGPVIGQVIMVITTTGNKSKLPRHNGAEYYTLNGKKYVICAFGQKAAWYKNIQADPRVTIQTARGTESMQTERVTDIQELSQVLDLFNRHDPLLTGWYLKSLGINPDRSDLLEKKDWVCILRFDPTNELTPPGLETDLKWVWLITGLLLVLLVVYRSAKNGTRLES